ncbi:MAG TPA: carboxypeptidase-like regulatory domain-containing protein [Anaerolineales bacterium]|nr:carboxypeptidase-like regulatory domain-containing protein [Anaerolineales bacterium]
MPTDTPGPVGDLGFGEVSGKVIDAATGAPILGATVTCEHYSYTSNAAERCNRSTTTDQSGNFRFEHVFLHDTDTITLTVEAAGYNSTSSKYSSFTRPVLEVELQLSAVGSESNTTSTGPTIANCPIFPPDNFWNARVDSLPTHPQSEAWIQSIGSAESFHMDFGSGQWDGGPIGIPYNIVAGSTVPKVEAAFYYPDESDSGPYPIPENPNIEWGSDHHILIVDSDTCTLYEMYDASIDNGQWSGGSGAIWDLASNGLRPETWTSADAAGLPILPGLVRYDEVAAGAIHHALRFTAEDTAGYIWPARHETSDPQEGVPPMGARFRLQADYDISSFPLEVQILLQAMKTYGIVLADNGSNWYVSGAPDERWDNDMLHLLDVLTGNDFEAVDTSSLLVDVNSGEVR